MRANRVQLGETPGLSEPSRIAFRDVSVAARAVRLVTRPRRVVTRLTRMHAALLRRSGGRIRRSHLFAAGQPVLSLRTTGRRSGEPRTTAVAYLRDGDGYAVFGANLGSTRDPDWCFNLAAEPRASIDVEGRRIEVVARRAEREEAVRLWAAYARRVPAVEKFREIAGREIPIMVLEEAPRERVAES